MEERVVGVVGVRDNSHVHHMFVAERYQRCGLATDLWRVAREACLEAGTPARFTVFSSKYALGVYRAFGFIESGPPEIKDEVIATPMEIPAPLWPRCWSGEIRVNVCRRNLRGVSTSIDGNRGIREARDEPTRALFFDNRSKTPGNVWSGRTGSATRLRRPVHAARLSVTTGK